jgi:DNA-binding HxlR family transcriptional regulator
METHRSLCPINLVVENIGDKWSFLILRDIIFRKRRHFNELLRESEEKIASNILRDRLAMLEQKGLLTKGKAPDDIHKQKLTYSLTEKSIDLLPMLMASIEWSLKYEPVDRERYKPAIMLLESGPKGVANFRKQLLKEHLGIQTNALPNGK